MGHCDEIPVIGFLDFGIGRRVHAPALQQLRAAQRELPSSRGTEGRFRNSLLGSLPGLGRHVTRTTLCELDAGADLEAATLADDGWHWRVSSGVAACAALAARNADLPTKPVAEG